MADRRMIASGLVTEGSRCQALGAEGNMTRPWQRQAGGSALTGLGVPCLSPPPWPRPGPVTSRTRLCSWVAVLLQLATL